MCTVPWRRWPSTNRPRPINWTATETSWRRPWTKWSTTYKSWVIVTSSFVKPGQVSLNVLQTVRYVTWSCLVCFYLCIPIKQCRSKSYVPSTIVSYRLYFYQVTALSYQVVYINLALRSTTVVLMHQWKLYKSHVLFFITKLIVLLSTKIMTSSLTPINFILRSIMSSVFLSAMRCTKK